MRSVLLLVSMIAAGMVAAVPSMADEETGTIQEVIIKIDTPNGPRWYSLGADLSKIEVKKGAIVRFNYADDTIENIQVEEVSAEGTPDTQD